MFHKHNTCPLRFTILESNQIQRISMDFLYSQIIKYFLTLYLDDNFLINEVIIDLKVVLQLLNITQRNLWFSLLIICILLN